MDPVTTAIIAGIVAGAVGGATKVVEQAVMDCYSELKSRLGHIFGEQSDVVQAVEGVEKNQDSQARQAVLQEEIEKSGAAQNTEILTAAQALLDKLQAKPEGAKIIQNVVGNQNAVSGSGDATVNVGTPTE